MKNGVCVGKGLVGMYSVFFWKVVTVEKLSLGRAGLVGLMSELGYRTADKMNAKQLVDKLPVLQEIATERLGELSAESQVYFADHLEGVSFEEYEVTVVNDMGAAPPKPAPAPKAQAAPKAKAKAKAPKAPKATADKVQKVAGVAVVAHQPPAEGVPKRVTVVSPAKAARAKKEAVVLEPEAVAAAVANGAAQAKGRGYWLGLLMATTYGPQATPSDDLVAAVDNAYGRVNPRETRFAHRTAHSAIVGYMQGLGLGLDGKPLGKE